MRDTILPLFSPYSKICKCLKVDIKNAETAAQQEDRRKHYVNKFAEKKMDNKNRLMMVKNETKLVLQYRTLKLGIITSLAEMLSEFGSR